MKGNRLSPEEEMERQNFLKDIEKQRRVRETRFKGEPVGASGQSSDENPKLPEGRKPGWH